MEIKYNYQGHSHLSFPIANHQHNNLLDMIFFRKLCQTIQTSMQCIHNKNDVFL